MNKDFDEWLNNVVSTLTKVAARQDLSRPALEQLVQQGYTEVEWESGTSTHAKCLELNHQKWPLEAFLSNLQHDAPIAERGHPNDHCTLLVSGEGLQTVRVNYDGNFEYI